MINMIIWYKMMETFLFLRVIGHRTSQKRISSILPKLLFKAVWQFVGLPGFSDQINLVHDIKHSCHIIICNDYMSYKLYRPARYVVGMLCGTVIQLCVILCLKTRLFHKIFHTCQTICTLSEIWLNSLCFLLKYLPTSYLFTVN